MVFALWGYSVGCLLYLLIALGFNFDCVTLACLVAVRVCRGLIDFVVMVGFE